MKTPESRSVWNTETSRRQLLDKTVKGGLALLVASIAPAVLSPGRTQAAAVISPLTRKIDEILTQTQLLEAVLPSYSPTTETQTPDLIEVTPEPGILNQSQWFPDDALVARIKKQVRMFVPGGPLDIYGQITGNYLPKLWEEERANASLRRSPLKRWWLGHCDDVVNVMAYRKPLAPELLRRRTFLFEGAEVNLTTAIGLQAVKHAHDVKVASLQGREGVKAVLAVAVIRKWGSVANILEEGQEGQVWSYLITKVSRDLEFVEAQNFGKVKRVSIDRIARIYFPYYYNPNDPETFNGIDEEVRLRTLPSFNPEVNHEQIDKITQNQP